jgi:dihydroxyacetone kinase
MKGEPKINVTPKFINTAESAVNDSLLGLIITNPQLGILESTNTVVLRQPKSNKVHLICGGGSGH